MDIEQERRFLILEHTLPVKSDDFLTTGQHFEQGMMISTPHEMLRVRIIGGQEVVITHKQGRGERRPEQEYPDRPDVPPIPLAAGRLMLDACRERIQKTRYRLDGWEIDFFGGIFTGLIFAELEGQPVQRRPNWVQKWVEITDHITNARLAKDAELFAHCSPEAITSAVLHHYLPER